MYVLVLFVIIVATIFAALFSNRLGIFNTELVKRRQRQRQGRVTKDSYINTMEEGLEKFRRSLKNIPNTKQDMSLIGDVKF